MYCSTLLCPIRLPLHPHPTVSWQSKTFKLGSSGADGGMLRSFQRSSL